MIFKTISLARRAQAMVRVRTAFIFAVGIVWLSGSVVPIPADGAPKTSEFRECNISEPYCGNESFRTLFGQWEGADTAAISNFGLLTIDDRAITWGGERVPVCKSRYQIVKRYIGGTYPDQAKYLRFLNPDRVYTTFLLKILSKECAREAEFFEVAAASDMSVMEVVTYGGAPTHVTGQIAFVRSTSGLQKDLPN